MNELEQDEAVRILNELITKAVPKVQLVKKYGGTLYTLKPDEKEGQFCGIFQYKSHVQLVFSQGAELQDPKNILAGNGKFRRHINFEGIEEIDKPVLNKFIKAAAKL